MFSFVPEPGAKMAAADGDDSLYPIAVLIDELRNEDVQVPTGAGEAGPRPGEAAGQGCGDPHGERRPGSGVQSQAASHPYSRAAGVRGDA